MSQGSIPRGSGVRERLKFRLTLACGLGLLLALSSGSLGAQAPHGTPAPGRWQPPPPPKSWTAPEVKGYTDGVTAAWGDLAAHLKPHPERQVLYQKPPATVKLDERYVYREGFRRGYDVVYAHQQPEDLPPAKADQG